MSARAEFLTTLRAGLRGAPASSIDEIVADYIAHFDEGRAANRSEADIAAALGDPLVLADELRLELCIGRFEAAPSPRSAAKVIGGAIVSGALNTLLLCIVGPLLALLALATALAILTAAGTGIWFLIAGASLGLPGGFGTSVLCGLGLLAAAVSMSALLLLGARALVGGIARHARLTYRFLPRVSKLGTPP
jgi:uncharacterized membrane protein